MLLTLPLTNTGVFGGYVVVGEDDGGCLEAEPQVEVDCKAVGVMEDGGGGGCTGAVTGGIRTSGAGAVATGGGCLWRLPDELDAWVDVAAAASCASRRSSFL